MSRWPRALLLTALCAVALSPIGCKQEVATPPQVSLDNYAQQYLRLCLALGERDPDSLDFYIGPAALADSVRRQPPKPIEIAQQAATIRDELRSKLAGSATFADPTATRRAVFLIAQLDAIQLRAEMLSGKTLSMDAESAVLFGVTAGADTEAAARASTRQAIGRLLGGQDKLAHRYTRFESPFVVPPRLVPTVMNAALSACRAATLAHIALPAGEHVDVQYVALKPWSAFSRYLGHGHSVIQVNMDYPLTVDRILTLACHEGYPGHHVFNMLRDVAQALAAHQDEWLAQPTFSPQSFVSEAAASYAPLIAFSPEERLRVERDVLYPLAGLNPNTTARDLQVEALVDSLDSADPEIARAYLDGRLEFVRAADALERETLMEHAETVLLYLNEYRSYMLSYTLGRRMVQREVESEDAPTDARWQRYIALMTSPRSSFKP